MNTRNLRNAPEFDHEPTPRNLSSPSDIRTLNMLPDRSADVRFNPVEEPSLTQQQFLQECDINYIVKQNEATGIWHHTARGVPLQGDFTEFGDATHFMSAKNYLIEAQAAFDALPADVRARFANDPGNLLDFVQNPDNTQEAIKLGLASAPPPPEEPAPKAPKKAPKLPDAPSDEQ